MKLLSYLALFHISLSNVLLVEATERTLTDIQGRVIIAKLLHKDEDSVLVKMVNGRTYDIAFKKLSTADQDFLLNWEPTPEIPKNPIEAVCIIKSPSAVGTGFFAYEKGQIYLYTNQHVISDVQNIKVTDSQGRDVKLGSLQVSNTHDLARYSVERKNALVFQDSVSANSKVAILGNSLGSGVITSGEGMIKGVGPFELEIDADFVNGNSGGPVLDSNNKVVGVSTYIIPADSKPNWVTEDTRYSKSRRFILRPTKISDWITIAPHDYAKQRDVLDVYQKKFVQAYRTYDLLVNGTGNILTIPENWEKRIKLIITSHNSRQKRPDSTTTNHYLNGFYQGSTTKSHASKKETSRRNNLRSLNDFVEDELSDRDFYNLNDWHLSVAYFRQNNYDGSELLQKQVSNLRKAIENEIELNR